MPEVKILEPHQLDIRPGDEIAIQVKPKEWIINSVEWITVHGVKVKQGGLVSQVWELDKVGPPF
ncbi:MAG: hypothetical protein F6K11_22855 [Leptolyngbya sp. SIO3F4]|nr:hypothetical protein [Leptolyngbya sp. SIO3F4]